MFFFQIDIWIEIFVNNDDFTTLNAWEISGL